MQVRVGGLRWSAPKCSSFVSTCFGTSNLSGTQDTAESVNFVEGVTTVRIYRHNGLSHSNFQTKSC